MFSKLSISLAVALLMSAAGGMARAAAVQTTLDAAEAGNPDSVDHAARIAGRHSPMNDEIDAAQVGSPDSIGNKDQASPVSTGNWRAAWQALESNDPDFG
jgi:hypothetical protein